MERSPQKQIINQVDFEAATHLHVSIVKPKSIQFVIDDGHDTETVKGLVQPRLEDIKLSFKHVKKQRLDRKFNLSKSLFQSWNTDLKEHFKSCLKADMKYSKINRFIKDYAER